MTGSLVCCLYLAAMAVATAPLTPAPPLAAADDKNGDSCCGQEDVALAGVEEEEGGGGGDRTQEEGGLGEEAKQPCPVACQCYRRPLPSAGLYDDDNAAARLLTVNCSGRGLVEFPEGLPARTEVLDLSHNKLQNLSSLPYLVELKALDLSSNWIRQLDNHWVFEHVSKLRTLSLADNALTALQHGTFSGLNSLRELDLSRNVIRRIETHAFTGLENLEILHLEKNQLFQLKREWLIALSSLQRLYVSDNKISTLDVSVFDKLPELQHLDISSNSLRDVADNAFSGLRSLKLLNFTGNSNMKEVPSRSLQPLPALSILLLDGLSISRLRPYAVSGLDVVELSLSYIPKLRVVERAAFHNMSSLRSLQLHDNPRLVYIHPAAFSSLPLLRHLHLHNNGLVAVSGQLVSSLPSLADLHLHHNPFHCDCNVYWLRSELGLEHPAQYRSRNDVNSPRPYSASSTWSSDDVITSSATSTASSSSTPSIISEPQRVSCFFQSGSSSMSMMQLPMEYFSPTCSPTVLPMFPPLINLTIGDELWLECQGLGVPAPTVSWVLPGGREINSSTPSWGNNDTVTEVVQETMLHIKPVSQSDMGTYGCRAVNSISEDIKTTYVRVQNKPLSISDVRLGSDYITLAWKGSIPRVQMSDFQLYYKTAASPTSDSGDSSRRTFAGYELVQLHGSTHKWTINGLQPDTAYEVCLVYKKIHPLQCSNYTTTTAQDVGVLVSDGIVRVSKSQIGLGFAGALGVVLLAVALLLVRRARRRKDYQGPLADEEKASIPLEAVAPTVPSTPLTSSRTALLTNSQI